MKILVTGGAGFIGSHLCDALIREGHSVWCLDNFMSGRKKNIAHLIGKRSFHVIKHDVRRAFPWSGSLDRIYHLACPASPVYYQFDPIETLETAVFGTREALRLAEKTGARMLLTSTSEYYGDPLEHPQKETYNGNVDALGPKACYEEGKRAGETLTKDYHEVRGVDARIIRFFNVYGPNMLFHDGRVVSNFVRQALLDEPITVHGDGTQTRSFLYIDDAIEALIALMEREGDDVFGPVNIGNPDERTILELAERIVAISHSSSKIAHISDADLPERKGDSRRRCPDISRLKEMLPEWRHDTPLDEGLKKTIADFRGRLDDKSRVAIIIPSFLPKKGPAEELVLDAASHLRDWSFDVITPLVDSSLPREEKREGVHIHRVGFGTSFDKYLLPLFGALKVLELNRKQGVGVLWAIPASYGALAARLAGMMRLRRFPVLYSKYSPSERASRGWRLWMHDRLDNLPDRVHEAGTSNDAEATAQLLRSLFNELEILGTKL